MHAPENLADEDFSFSFLFFYLSLSLSLSLVFFCFFFEKTAPIEVLAVYFILRLLYALIRKVIKILCEQNDE